MKEFKQGMSLGLILASVISLTKAVEAATPETIPALKGLAVRLMSLIDKLVEEISRGDHE